MELQTLLLALVCICFLRGDEHSTVRRADEGLQDYVPLYPLTCPINTHASFKKELLAGFLGVFFLGILAPVRPWRVSGDHRVMLRVGPTTEQQGSHFR